MSSLRPAGDKAPDLHLSIRRQRQMCIRDRLKGNQSDIEDGIGDAVVVLTNLAHLCDTDIEHCIESAYNEIKDRTGKMDNGTFKKD